MKLIKSIMSAFAIVLAATACAGNGGENKKSNEPTKEDNKMEVVSLNKAEFLKKVYDFEANPNDWKFEGKRPAIVDFYATWCGPCRTANKAITPMKEELKDKDIIYLYITGETSPKGTWENMITDIHGEHFRVTNEQWSFLMSNFNIRGVPTYFVVDPEGNITFKQTGFPGVDTMKKELMKALNK